MKTLIPCILATLIPCTLVAEDRDHDNRDRVQVGQYLSIGADGLPHTQTYIITTSRKNGTGLGVTTDERGKGSTYLVTPSIIVETSRDR